MNELFKRDALAELIHAMNYLDEKVNGLGDALHDEVTRAIELIKDQPDRWPVLIRDVHRYRLNRFNYYVIYQVRRDRILILAIMHTHQRPGYWRRRLSQ